MYIFEIYTWFAKMEVRNLVVTNSSCEIELCKMTSHLKLLTRNVFGNPPLRFIWTMIQLTHGGIKLKQTELNLNMES